MDILQNSINFLLSLGAAIFVPIIIIVAGLIVRMKLKDAISSGITLGVAFSGMMMLISYMSSAITPAAEAMVETIGVELPITDGGWTTMSTISWSWPYAFLMFPLVIGINVLLIILKQTNTFNADLWTVWGKIFTAVAVFRRPYLEVVRSLPVFIILTMLMSVLLIHFPEIPLFLTRFGG